MLEESMKTFEEESKDLQSQDEQVGLLMHFILPILLLLFLLTPSLGVSCAIITDYHLSLGTNHSESVQYEQ